MCTFGHSSCVGGWFLNFTVKDLVGVGGGGGGYFRGVLRFTENNRKFHPWILVIRGGWRKIVFRVTVEKMDNTEGSKNGSLTGKKKIHFFSPIPSLFLGAGVENRRSGDGITRYPSTFRRTSLSWNTKFSPSHRNVEHCTHRHGLQRMCVL